MCAYNSCQTRGDAEVNSNKLIKQYSTLKYWWSGLRNASWKMLRDLPGQTNNSAACEIEADLFRTMKKIEALYGPEIGKAIIAEVEV